jgi:DNA-directed RNA polymerase subunit F
MMKCLLSEKCTRLLLLSTLLYLLSFARLFAADLHPCLLLADTDSIRYQKGTSNWIYRNNGSSSSLSYNGKIIFTEDDRDIKSISPGGFFKYNKTTFGNCREIQILSDMDGTLRRRYFVGRSEEPYEPEGRKWLQEMLPGIIATTGIGAEDRVQRIYAKSGVNGVMQEIGKLESDHVQSIYFSYLVTQPRLKDSEMRHILAQVDKSIDSDYEKGKLLRKTGPYFLQHEKVTPEYLNAINNMSSDYEKAKAISFVLQQGKLSPAGFTQALNTISGISSDYDQAKVLRQVIAHPALPERACKEIFAQLGNVDSDYEKNRIIFAVMSNQKLVDQHFNEVVNAVRNIRSDYEKSRALAYLVTKHKLTTQNYLQVFPVVADINSSYEKSKTLQRLKTTMPTDNEQVRAAYLKTAKTITSDHEYQRVMHGVEQK